MTRRERLARDLGLLRRLGGLVIGYAVAGGKLRRALARHERDGTTLYVDDELGS